MKKVILSLAGVLAATAFAPEAAAVPSFARQTGMACTACHFQHIPVLSSFGRAFKAGGYTMMGAQGKVEGEHLSIPDTLNASLLLKARYQKANGTDAPGTITGTSANSGVWQIPDELSLFFGGRIAENAGFIMENNLVGGPLGGIIAGLKVPFVFDMGGVKLGVQPYLTDALGAFYGYDLSSTGQIRGIRWAEHRKDVSAQQFVGTSNGAATGLALSAQNDMGYVAVSRFSPNFAAADGVSATELSSTALRIVATPTLGDWGMHIGVGLLSGTNYSTGGANAPTLANKVDTKGSNFDVQAQGNLGGADTSLYLTYATAPASTATSTNLYNSKVDTAKSATTIGIEYSVVPHVAHVGFAYRAGKNGAAAGSNKDNAVTLTGIYELAQNVELVLNFSKYSGDTAVYPTGSATSLTTFMLEAAW